jgi:hypothetical protein
MGAAQHDGLDVCDPAKAIADLFDHSSLFGGQMKRLQGGHGQEDSSPPIDAD